MKGSQRIEIGNSFYYWETTPQSTLQDALVHAPEFVKLRDVSTKNLTNVLGPGQHYVWVRADFKIPPKMRHKPLGLVIPHLTFAEKLYCNEVFISEYGKFPPNEQSTLFKAHFFSFPLNILNQMGDNTILIKVFVQGNCGISTHSRIQPTGDAYSAFEIINFRHTRIYMFLMGMLLFTALLYMCFYINIRELKEFRDLSLLSLITAVFIIPFFATELPVYTNGSIPFLPFIKYTWCVPGYLIGYIWPLFVTDFHHKKFLYPVEIVRLFILLTQTLLTIFVPTYPSLREIAPILLVMLAAQIGVGIVQEVRYFVNRDSRSTSIQFLFAFLPLFLAAVFDVILRIKNPSEAYPYFLVFGWQVTMLVFIIMLCIRFSHMYRRNEQLTDNLQEEVDSRTQDLQSVNHKLSLLNEHLEEERFKADLDLQMASLVQQRFFPQPNNTFKGWDIAVYYNPQAIVSGDLYDYYNTGDKLNGLALFDVSGHGISASLVTMLSKNIISHAFLTGTARKDSIASILTRINKDILREKGDIDNYLTGVLCRFEESADANVFKAILGNAGHPYPLKFCAKDQQVYELRGNDGKQHYGAIGMKGIDISFATTSFEMEEGDILLCYTDGITESMNVGYEQFGTETIKWIMKNNYRGSADEILHAITRRFFEFTRGKPIEDDITLFVAKRVDVSTYVSKESNDERLNQDDDVAELLPVDE